MRTWTTTAACRHPAWGAPSSLLVAPHSTHRACGPPNAAAGFGYHAPAYPSPRGTSRHILASLALYCAAVACDSLDRPLHLLTLGLISGHTLKHLLAGAAGGLLLAAVGQRT